MQNAIKKSPEMQGAILNDLPAVMVPLYKLICNLCGNNLYNYILCPAHVATIK